MWHCTSLFGAFGLRKIDFNSETPDSIFITSNLFDAESREDFKYIQLKQYFTKK